MNRVAQRVRAALAFEPVIVAGMTFVPQDALEGVRWGVGPMPALIAAACSRLRPDFVFLPASEPWAEEAVDRVAACGVAPVWVVDGPFGAFASAESWTEAVRLSAADPGAAGAKMDERLPALTEKVRRGVRLGAVAIVIAEDLAGADGPLLAPDFALEEVMPRVGALAETASEQVTPSIFHSDGDVRWLLPSLRRHGFAAVHPGGLSAQAFETFLQAANDKDIAVLGGLPGDVLRSGGPAVIRAATHASVRALKGGLLITDDGGISTAEELASLVTALQVARASIGEVDRS